MGPLTAAAPANAAVAPSLAAVDPAAFLGRLIDLRGSVELAQRLGALERARLAGPAPNAAAARAELRALVTERLDVAGNDVLRVFGDPFHRRNKLPTPEDVVTLLVDGGALRERKGKALTSAAEAVWSPCGDLITRALDRVRFELSTLRDEIGPSLAALGPAAARLEKLDAAVFAATAKGRRELEDKLVAAVARAFANDFAAAVAALPGATAPAHVRPWFAPGGFLRVALDRGRDVVLGVLAHDRRRMEAMVEAGETP